MSETNGKIKGAETRRTIALPRPKPAVVREPHSTDAARELWAQYNWRALNLESTAGRLRHWHD